MLAIGFLFGATILDLALGGLVLFKSYRTAMRALLAGLSGLFVAYLWIGWTAVSVNQPGALLLSHLALQAIGLLISLGILELTRNFLREGEAGLTLKWGGLRISLNSVAALGTAAAIGSLWLPGTGVQTGKPMGPFNLGVA